MNELLHTGPLMVRFIKNKERKGEIYGAVRIVNGVSTCFPYQGARDAKGVLTIAYGHVISPEEKLTGKFEQGLTEEQAEALLLRDLGTRFERPVRSAIKVALKQHQFDALVSLVYNCGPAPLYGSTGSAINAKDFNKAVFHIATDYVKTDPDGAGPKPKAVTDGLVRRRMSEAWLFHTGEFFNADTPQKRDILIKRLEDKGLLPPGLCHCIHCRPGHPHWKPDYERYPKIGYPA